MSAFHRSREEKIREKADADGPTLDLSNAYIGDEGCADVVRILRQYPMKKVLDLRGNRIQADGLCFLAAMLKTNLSLAHVNLEWNCIGVLDHGMEALASALALNTALTHLDLRNNSIGPDGAILLATALRRNRTLEELDLRWNEIGTAGGHAILDMLRSDNTTLVRLQLMGNNVPMAAADAIDLCLKRNEQAKVAVPQANDDDSVEANPAQDDDDPRLLLEFIADKERLACDVDAAKRQVRAMETQLEAHEATIASLHRELTTTAADRDRFERREAAGRQQVTDVTALLEQSEARRKSELDDATRLLQTAENMVLALKEEKFQLERAVARLSDEVDAAKKSGAQESRLLDADNQKLRVQWTAAQDEIARLREQVHDERKALDRREKQWQVEADEAKAAAARRAESMVQMLEQQLRHVTSQAESSQMELQAQRELQAMYQTQLLQLKVQHEAALGDLSAKMDKECQERVDRAVASVDAQVDEMRRQRVQLESDVEKHHMALELLRDEKSRQKKVFDEEVRERETRAQEWRDALAAKEDAMAALESDLMRQMRRHDQMAERISQMEGTMDAAAKAAERRLTDMHETLAAEKKCHDDAMGAAREKERRLLERIAALEVAVDRQKHEHDATMARFVARVAAHAQELLDESRQ
ncbi:Aste57867_22047 [Aphanomyces stellatus]|uniref:Aste57867_22047 protein n=1 Tax=Aphanomyces stellatus TaxID=120398 RepID=A0A485LJV7_9STRA|nr:hypothetical protein As57867_021978 [Aphanomyces stellatus]VFT98715.1 Aste57867_22047 [Aphanomyces stellatus]